MAKRRARGTYPRQSQVTRSELEAKIPGGAVTPELRRQQPIDTEVIARDGHGFPIMARQRVRNRFLTLAQDGLLSVAEATAALQLRAYYDSYWRGVTGSYQMKVDGGSRPGESMASKMHYAQQVQGALTHLNSELRKIACAYILEADVPQLGKTFLSVGESYFPTMRDEERKRIAGKALVIATCRELAIYWRMQSPFEFDIHSGITGIKLQRIRGAINPPTRISDGERSEWEAAKSELAAAATAIYKT